MTVSTRAAVDADRAFVERVFFETQRWIIETLFGWRGDDIERATFAESYDAPNTRIIVVDAIDCGWMTPIRTAVEIELESIYIITEMQRRGVGTLLIGQLIEQSQRTSLPLTLSTAKINPARALYERLGFSTVGENKFKVFMQYDPTFRLRRRLD